MKRGQGKGGGRERKTEWETGVYVRAHTYTHSHTYTYSTRRALAGASERGEHRSGRRTVARGPESRRSEHVLLSASRARKKREAIFRC